MHVARTHFAQAADRYAAFRPGYPASLAAALAGQCLRHRLAVDIGCGNGQLTRLLAASFDRVVGTDVSHEQLARAPDQDAVGYVCHPAEQLPLVDDCADLITVAQAVHWFDLELFYMEVGRVMAPGGLLALLSYGVPQLSGTPGPRLEQFYWQEIHDYWPAPRRRVENGYADLPFPFHELPRIPARMSCDWTLSAFLGYISTWSAVRNARDAGKGELIASFVKEMAALWGDEKNTHRITWPIAMRLGRIA